MEMKHVVLTSAVISVASLGYAYFTGRKLEKLYELTVNNLTGKLDVKISDEIINEAVGLAVDREVNSRVRIEASAAATGIKSRVYSEIKVAVDSSLTDIKSAVTAEATKQVANIDISELKKEIKEKAKDEVLKKFNNELDALLDDFNQNLTNVSKIYSSIAENMTKNKETVFKIN